MRAESRSDDLRGRDATLGIVGRVSVSPARAAARATDCAPAHGLAHYVLEQLLPSFINCPGCESDEPERKAPFGHRFWTIVHRRDCGLAASVNAYEPGRCRVEGSNAR